MQLKKIKVYGKLRKFLGQSTFEAAVSSPQQAYNFLKANFVGIEKHMSNQVYKVKIGGRVVTQDFLNMKGQGEIQIIPIAVGADFVVDFIEGAFNFAADAVNFVFDNALTLGAAFVTGGWSAVAQVAALTLASDLLTPDQPTQNISAVGDTDPNIRGSYNFSGIQNVSSSGIPIPIIYGHVFSGSILISSGVDNAQIVNIINNTGTYSQSGETLTIYINNHNYRNGESVRFDFISGPLHDHPTLGTGRPSFGVENVTTNTFKSPLGMWGNQTYGNSDSNVVKVTDRFFW